MTSNREQRQYNLMRERVADFRAGRGDIGPLISALEGLLSALQETPNDWRERFVEGWSGLEIAYAVALDRGTALPTAGDIDVGDSLDDLDELLAEVLDDA